ncbi:MAG: thioesterase family protein [Chloroflexota bacterium]|nr:thioesterase family protein [Chloroflexota bacterium]
MTQFQTKLEDIRQLDRLFERSIPPAFLDENRHVNVQYYVHLIEQGIVAFFQRVGLGEAYAAADEIGNFALEQHIRYLAEILVDDRVSVYIRLIDLSPKRAYFMGFLINDTREELASTVEVVMMNVDMKLRRGRPFPPAAKTELDALLQQHRNLPWTAPVCGVMRA